MGQNSNIEWTDHTWNPWWGCVKVSDGCKFCYADAWAARTGNNVWGPNAPRRFFGEKHWREPLKWNLVAEAAGVRARVFCASMADVFEELPAEHPDRQQMEDARMQLWATIAQTPHLDWQLLTKRPENVLAMLPSDWGDGWPNVWLGTSVEDQPAADKRIPELLKVPAAVRFLSFEPLIAAVDLFSVPGTNLATSYDIGGISWIIAGGESGPKARPMAPEWARDLRDTCAAAAIPFFFKQWGEWAPGNDGAGGDLYEIDRRGVKSGFFDYCGRFNPGANPYRQTMDHIGKKAAGRLLDGREWSEFPAARGAR